MSSFLVPPPPENYQCSVIPSSRKPLGVRKAQYNQGWGKNEGSLTSPEIISQSLISIHTDKLLFCSDFSTTSGVSNTSG